MKLTNELKLEKENNQKLNEKIKNLEETPTGNQSQNSYEKPSVNVNMINDERNRNTQNNDVVNINKVNEESNLNVIKNSDININKVDEDYNINNINGINDINNNIEEENEQENLLSELNKELKYFNDNLNNTLNEDKINDLLEEIRIKDKIISSYPVQLIEGEKLLTVIFVSLDNKINYSVLCKNTNKFNEIENMLYDAYPEYAETENNFTVNGKNVNKYESLEINNIKNNDRITLTTNQ